jgi:hypothetical protein
VGDFRLEEALGGHGACDVDDFDINHFLGGFWVAVAIHGLINQFRFKLCCKLFLASFIAFWGPQTRHVPPLRAVYSCQSFSRGRVIVQAIPNRPGLTDQVIEARSIIQTSCLPLCFIHMP